MNIYSIRDRLIDYYMRPFFMESDKGVMAAISEIVNDQENKSAIAQAPHQFEIWKLGQVEETGEVKPDKQYIADASGLVRTGLRESPGDDPGENTGRAVLGPRRSTPSGDQGGAPTPPKPHENAAQTAPQ